MIKSFFLIALAALPSFALGLEIKDADLAGSWYPAESSVLSQQIQEYLDHANPPAIDGEILAIISPHAGIAYSGPVAAFSFKILKDKKIDKVIVVGFSHRKDYDGIAIFNKDGFKTPLGTLFTEKKLTKSLLTSNKKFLDQPGAFNQENSVEMILPFVQVALGNPKIVLLAIGRQTQENYQLLSESLYQALNQEKNFLVIASTDMSHYLPSLEAEATDTATAELIKQMDPEKLFLICSGKNRLCGTAAVAAVISAAKKLGANKSYLLKVGNSGDTTKDKSQVVGYLSAAFTKTESDKMENLLSEQQKSKLLKIARFTIQEYLTKNKAPEITENDPVLKQVMGAFVTLHEQGKLRGCIGNIVGQEPLYLTVRDMAIAAATDDPRFQPVTKDELKNIHIEISALSPLRKIANPDEIILGKHGVLVRSGFYSGVYLPQVATETGWSKEEFMNSLCESKAGIDADAWKTGKCDIYVFSAEVFGE